MRRYQLRDLVGASGTGRRGRWATPTADVCLDPSADAPSFSIQRMQLNRTLRRLPQGKRAARSAMRYDYRSGDSYQPTTSLQVPKDAVRPEFTTPIAGNIGAAHTTPSQSTNCCSLGFPRMIPQSARAVTHSHVDNMESVQCISRGWQRTGGEWLDVRFEIARGNLRLGQF